MEPRIDTEPFVEALAGLIAMKAAGPPGMERFDAAAARESFRTGKVAMLIDRAERAADWSHGKPVRVAPLPGSERVFDPGSGAWTTPAQRNTPSYLPHGGGWLIGIRSGLPGSQREAAIDLVKYLASPENSNRIRADRAFPMLPFRTAQMGQGLPDPTSAPDVDTRLWAEAVGRTFAERAVVGLRIPAPPTTWPTWPKGVSRPSPAPRRRPRWRMSPEPGPRARRPSGRIVSSGIIVAASTSRTRPRSPRNEGPDPRPIPARSARLTLEDETDESPATLSGDIETEIKEMMGLFDAPAFARGGRSSRRCSGGSRCGADRPGTIGSRWSESGCGSGPASRAGPDAWTAVFAASIEPLWPLSGAEPPQWGATLPPPRHRQLAVARDLIAAVERFNRRWTEFLESLHLGAANVVIDHYNRYYVLEKECVMGSGRLAARFFTPIPLLTPAQLLREHPLLPVPALIDRGRGA